MSSAALVLYLVPLAGLTTVGVIFGARLRDQGRRDRQRRAFLVSFPRSVTAEQVGTFVQALVGLASPRTGLLGRDSAVLEVVGTRRGIAHRLRLPKSSATYFLHQARASVPGLSVTPLEAEDRLLARLPALTQVRELRLTTSERALSVSDPATVSRTVLAACSGLGSGDTLVWQITVVGGTPRPAAGRQPQGLRVRLQGHRVVVGDVDHAGSGLPARLRKDPAGVTGVVVRLGAAGRTPERACELLARLGRAAASVSAPRTRLVPRLLPAALVRRRLAGGTTPLIESPALLSAGELVALLGWPIGAPLIPGLTLGSSPQLAVSPDVPRGGRILGDSTVGTKRPIAQSRKAALEHSIYLGPTGSGKSWLAAGVALGDIAAGSGCLLIDPKGGLVTQLLQRLPEEAIERTIVVDPTDEARPVPVPLLVPELGGIPELAADTLVSLLRHRYRDLGPRSTDILTSSLYALARRPNVTILDLLRLWSSPGFRAEVAAGVQDDPALATFFAWLIGLSGIERSFVLAAPMNKIRPLLQRPVVRNVLAAPRATFTMAEALAQRLVVLVTLPEGVLGPDATGLLGQVLLARLWAAIQGRPGGSSRRPYFVAVDESPRFLDAAPTDLGDVLVRSREYGVGVTLIAQSLSMFPTGLREVVLNSARTKVAFQSTGGDARRLADEFGPGVTPDMLTGLAAYEAIGVVSVVGAVSPPFTLRTRPLPDKIPGRAAAVRKASRERWGIPREEIEASFRRDETPPGSPGPVGRRVQP